MENDNKENRPLDKNDRPIRRPRPNLDNLKNLPGNRKQEFKNRVAHSIEKNKSNLSQENPSQPIVEKRVQRLNSVKQIAGEVGTWLQNQLNEYNMEKGDVSEEDYNKLQKGVSSLNLNNNLANYITGQLLQSVMSDMKTHAPMGDREKQNLPRINQHHLKRKNMPSDKNINGINTNDLNELRKQRSIDRKQDRRNHPSGHPPRSSEDMRPSDRTRPKGLPKNVRPAPPTDRDRPKPVDRGRGRKGMRGDIKDPQWS